jgi:hypothetical protein
MLMTAKSGKLVPLPVMVYFPVEGSIFRFQSL